MIKIIFLQLVMNIIIKTGFEKICHNIIFQPETMPKGKELVKAEHVHDVQEQRFPDKDYIYISAHVIRQTSVTSTSYVTTLTVNIIIFIIICV